MKLSGIMVWVLFGVVRGETCETTSDVYIKSEDFDYVEGCYRNIFSEDGISLSHYDYSPQDRELSISIKSSGTNTATLNEEGIICIIPDALESGEMILEPCYDLETFDFDLFIENGNNVDDSFDEITGKSVTLDLSCGCEIPDDVEYCNFQFSGGNGNLNDLAYGYYDGNLDGCYYAEFDTERHFMTDGVFPLQYVLDGGDNPVGEDWWGNPASPTLVKLYDFNPSDVYVESLKDEFDLSKFVWILDVFGTYWNSVSTDEDPLIKYNTYAIWSPEDKDSPVDITTWFAMRRNEDGDVFMENVSEFISFKCGCGNENDDIDSSGSSSGSNTGSNTGSIIGGVVGGLVGLGLIIGLVIFLVKKSKSKKVENKNVEVQDV